MKLTCSSFLLFRASWEAEIHHFHYQAWLVLKNGNIWRSCWAPKRLVWASPSHLASFFFLGFIKKKPQIPHLPKIFKNRCIIYKKTIIFIIFKTRKSNARKWIALQFLKKKDESHLYTYRASQVHFCSNGEMYGGSHTWTPVYNWKLKSTHENAHSSFQIASLPMEMEAASMIPTYYHAQCTCVEPIRHLYWYQILQY